MAASKSRLIVFIAVPVMILLLPLTIYMVDSAQASNKVARNVTVAGIDVARQTETEALASVDVYEKERTANMATVVVNGKTYDLDPADVGLSFDSQSAIDEALTLRKDGLRDWLAAFSESVDVPLTASLDEDLVALKLVEWEQDAIANPAFEGSIVISNGTVSSEYPRSGDAIDRTVASMLLLTALESGSEEAVVLPIVSVSPTFRDQDIDDAVTRAKTIISRGVVLTNNEYGFEFRVTPTELGTALRASVTSGANPSIEFSVDSTVILPLIEVVRSGFEIEPIDAYWETVLVDDFEDFPDQYEIKDSPQEDLEGLPENDTITLKPGLNGTTIDPEAVAVAVELAALADGTGELAVQKNTEPAFTTAMAEAYGTMYELAEFTTRTPGRNRVHNIQLMATIVDQTIVMPGEEFSVNEVVGKRKTEDGFKYDCAIVGGELACEKDPVNVGGGVSQFGTTIFNTIYFSCLEVVEHQPHSIYFTKYPEGREATLGFPHPDVKFFNNTNAPVIIRTSFTPRTITVTFFGNHEGRKCGTERGERTGFTKAAITYRADEDGEVVPGEEFIANEGSGGWRIINWRIFYDVDGNEIERETFPWTYRGERQVILMHPCEEKVGGDGVCPTQVPDIVGLKRGDAESALTNAGFTVVVFDEPTSDETENGIVLSSSPSDYQDAGTEITINVGEWDNTPPPAP